MQERLTYFREILRYVPRFRDRVFVIAIDGAVVEHENFQNWETSFKDTGTCRRGRPVVVSPGPVDPPAAYG